MDKNVQKGAQGLNTPPHVYITVWEDLHNTAQMYCIRKERGRDFILASKRRHN